jgi:hypothetical protein
MAISLKSLFRNIKDTTEKVSKNKNLGKLIGASYFTKTPSLALADVGGKIGIKGLDSPFFKGAAQGSRMAMGAAGLMGAIGLAGGGAAGANVPNANFAGGAGETTTTASGISKGGSSMLNKIPLNFGGGENESTNQEQVKKQIESINEKQATAYLNYVKFYVVII